MNGRNDTQEVEDDGFYTVEFPEDYNQCPNCEGTGSVTGAWAAGAMASDIDECPVCRGTGVLP